MKKSAYRGIAIFGAPGTGKTTLAQAIKRRLPYSVHIEASSALIAPALAARGLPFTREHARRLSAGLAKERSPEHIARKLILIHRKLRPKKEAIISGSRGFRNALHFKRSGYLTVFLSTTKRTAVSRLMKRDSLSYRQANRDIENEERAYGTRRIKMMADLSLDAGKRDPERLTEAVVRAFAPRECRICVNAETNPSVDIGESGLCGICAAFCERFDPSLLKEELDLVKRLGRKSTKAMVGFSGGKDSTATLATARSLGFRPLAFTLDSGYYPAGTFTRASRIAKRLGIAHERIDIRDRIRSCDRSSFRSMAELYAKPDSMALREKFRALYAEGRKHYSIKCAHALPFVRTCQLCRRVVIRAYYAEAVKRGIRVVILGMNEWAGLSSGNFSAIRKLKPYKNRPAVLVVHLPFLLRRKLADTRDILRKLGWKLPPGEALVESNSNSCLLARAAETKATRLLGFHPDTTRLAREVTVGFLTKTQARRALAKTHRSRLTVRQILNKADII